MKKLISVALMSAGLLAQPAFAKLQTFSFSGVVERMQMSYWDFTPWGTYEYVERQVDHAGSWGGNGFAVGERFSGTFTVDDDPAHVRDRASLSLVFSGGNPAVSFGAGEAMGDIQDYLVEGVRTQYLGVGAYSEEFNLLELNLSALIRRNSAGGMELDASRAGISGKWRSPENISGSSGRTNFTARLDSITDISPVPEPATYGMLLAGLGLLGVAVRRNGKQLRNQGR